MGVYNNIVYDNVVINMCVCAGVCERAGAGGRIFVIFGINLTFFDICGICRILGILGLFRKCLTFLVFVLSPAFLEYLRSLWHSCKAPKGLYLKVLWHSWHKKKPPEGLLLKSLVQSLGSQPRSSFPPFPGQAPR